MKANCHDQQIEYFVKNWRSRKRPFLKPLVGRYCILRPLNRYSIHRYAKSLYLEFKNQDELWTYLPFGPFGTYRKFKQWLCSASKEKMFFILFHQNNNFPYGIVSYHHIEPAHGVIEIGTIVYSRILQKTSAATEGIYLMLKHVFDDLAYRRCQWRCDSLNKVSCLAAERLGFKFEGIFRQSNVFKSRNRDTAWFSIVDKEWPEIKKCFETWLRPENFDAKQKQIKSLSIKRLSKPSLSTPLKRKGLKINSCNYNKNR